MSLASKVQKSRRSGGQGMRPLCGSSEGHTARPRPSTLPTRSRPELTQILRAVRARRGRAVGSVPGLTGLAGLMVVHGTCNVRRDGT